MKKQGNLLHLKEKDFKTNETKQFLDVSRVNDGVELFIEDTTTPDALQIILDKHGINEIIDFLMVVQYELNSN